MGNGLCVETSSSWTVFDWLDKVLGSIGSYAGVTKSRSDDHFADRLSHHYTPVILIIFTIIVSTKQYAGDPIQCWCPAQFTDAHVEYTKMVCWVSSTYYLPMSEVIPKDISERDEAKIPYYQWVPIILLFMALMFKIPRIFWKAVSNAVGLSIDKVTNLVFRLEILPIEGSGDDEVQVAERANAMNGLILYLDTWFRWRVHYNDNRFVRASRKVAEYTCLCANRRHGNYFFTASVVTKMIYFAHALLQFFLLNLFLGADFITWGFKIISGEIDEDSHYQQNSVFPKVTLCDFELRQLQNVQRTTVQCVLSINLFNTRIFLFVWCWLAMLVVASFYTLVVNVYALIIPGNRTKYIKKYLKLFYLINPERLNQVNDKLQNDDHKSDDTVPMLGPDIRRHVKKHFSSYRIKEDLKSFVFDYLKFDGVFVLRVMSHSGNEILTAEIMHKLWRNYVDRRREMKYMGPSDDTKKVMFNGTSNIHD